MLSNRALITILIVSILILVALVGVWLIGKSGESEVATTTVHALPTKEEKAEDQAFMIRFATPAPVTVEKQVASDKFMDSFSPPVQGVNEGGNDKAFMDKFNLYK